MKKLIFCFLISFSSISLFGQDVPHYTSDELSQNENLRIFITKMLQFSEIIINNHSEEELQALPSFFEIAQRNNEVSYEEQLQLVVEKLKLSGSEVFVEYYESQRNTLNSLHEQFGVPINELEQDTLKLAINKILTNYVEQNSMGCEHPWKYRLCAGAKSFEGGIMLHGCLAMAGVSAGILTGPAVACLAGVTVWLANELNTCYKTYCHLSPLKLCIYS